MTLVTRTAYVGIEVLLLICSVVLVRSTAQEKVQRRALLKVRQPGTPRSRANAQQIRDIEAVIPALEVVVIVKTMDSMIAAPTLDRTALWKMTTKGKAALPSSTEFKSPMRIKTVSIIPKPRAPFIAMPNIIERGMIVCASRISSASCLSQQSKPGIQFGGGDGI